MPRLTGTNYSLEINFPLREGVLVRCQLFDRHGLELEKWEKPVDKADWQRWGPWAGLVERFISDLFRKG